MVSTSSTETARFLIDNKANLNLVNKNGETPLHYSIKVKNKHMVTLLVTFGSDLNISSSEGTPLQLSILTGDSEMTDHLLRIEDLLKLNQNNNNNGNHFKQN